MNIIPKQDRFPTLPGDISDLTHKQAVELKDESIWSNLANVRVLDAVNGFLSKTQDNPHTIRGYQGAFNMLVEFGFMDPVMNLQVFSLLNHNDIIDQIKRVDTDTWKERTKQARAAFYISLTTWLERKTQGVIKRALPNKEGSNKTFFKINDKVETKALSKYETNLFINSLSKISKRDALIAKIQLQGAKRINEVLSLKGYQVFPDEEMIRFIQSKTHKKTKIVSITYPKEIFKALAIYSNNKTEDEFVFQTKKRKAISYTQIYKNYRLAGARAGLKNISTHVLRATAVTRLKEKHFSNDEIQIITGHADPRMVGAYDKSDLENNISKEYNLVNIVELD